MNRAYIVLPKRHTHLHHRLKVICAERNLSVGEVVGELVAQYVAEADQQKRKEAIAALESLASHA